MLAGPLMMPELRERFQPVSKFEMRIDAHQHFWHYHPERLPWISEDMEVLKQDFLPHHLEPLLAQTGLEGCIAVQTEHSEDETNFLLDLAAQHDFIKGVVGWVDLRAENVEERLVHFCRNPFFRGVRHIVQDEPDDHFLLNPDFLRGMRYLKTHDLTYDILIFPRHLDVAETFVSYFPSQKFVLDHLAKPNIQLGVFEDWKKRMHALAKHPSVYCKVSGMVTEADWYHWSIEDFTPFLDVVFDAFGTERVMFGSDWPVCTLAASYKQVTSIVADYLKVHSEEDQHNIMGRNCLEFYGIPS